VNTFDLSIIHFLNEFSQRSQTFDVLVALITKTDLFRGGVIAALFLWAWVKSGNESEERRGYLLFGMIASVFSVLLARGLALSLPYRIRPLRSPSLNFHIPFGTNPDALVGWSSFPSDHATLFVCLSTAIWFASKRLGAIAFCWTSLFILVPRIYLGIHYPTDILAGALLGLGIACLSKITWLRKGVTKTGMCWLQAHPASFYTLLFLCWFEIIESFTSLRDLLGFSLLSVHTALNSLH